MDMVFATSIIVQSLGSLVVMGLLVWRFAGVWTDNLGTINDGNARVVDQLMSAHDKMLASILGKEDKGTSAGLARDLANWYNRHRVAAMASAGPGVDEVGAEPSPPVAAAFDGVCVDSAL